MKKKVKTNKDQHGQLIVKEKNEEHDIYHTLVHLLQKFIRDLGLAKPSH